MYLRDLGTGWCSCFRVFGFGGLGLGFRFKVWGEIAYIQGVRISLYWTRKCLCRSSDCYLPPEASEKFGLDVNEELGYPKSSEH